jgi:hypothetical protein
MSKTAANIVVGAPSTIICSPDGEAEGSGVDLGSTVGGFIIRPTLSIGKKKADQWNGPVGAYIMDSEYTFECTLAEVSTANLAYAMGLPTTAASSATALTAGNTTVATVRTLYVNCNAVSGGSAKYTIHRCVFDGNTEISLNRETQTNVKITGFMLIDTSQSAGEEYFSLAYSSTDTTPPTVAMTSPVEDATVAKDGKETVTLTFTEADNAIDQGTLIYGSSDNATVMLINVTDTADSTLVAGSISYDATTKVLTFTPTSNWTGSDSINIIITTGVRDTAGNHLADMFIGHFTVAA